MLRFILTRLSQMLVSLLVITLIVFSLSHLTGNPVNSLLPDDATPQQIASLTENSGPGSALLRAVPDIPSECRRR